MGPDDQREPDGMEGVIDRHGDEVADELAKTIRTTRRLSVVMFAVFGVVVVAIAALIVWMIANF